MGETISILPSDVLRGRKCRKLVLVDLGRTDIWVMPWQVIMLRLWRTTMEGDDSLAHLAHASFGEWSMGEERKTFSCQIMMNEIVMEKRTRQITCHFVFFFLTVENKIETWTEELVKNACRAHTALNFEYHYLWIGNFALFSWIISVIK